MTRKPFCDLWSQPLKLIRFAKLRHQQENPRQKSCAGVEEMIEKVGLRSHGVKKKFDEYLEEGRLLVHRAEHLLSLYLQCRAVVNGGS